MKGREKRGLRWQGYVEGMGEWDAMCVESEGGRGRDE